MTVALLAHQGGWDEVLMVAAPLVLFGVLLRVANRRNDERVAGSHDDDHVSPPDE